MNDVYIPTYDEMFNPLLQALRELGGSGRNDELENEVARIMDLTDEQLEIIHDPERSSRSEFSYRLAWTRTYLKKHGLIENSSRGVWALTSEGKRIEYVNERDLVRHVRQSFQADESTEDKDVVDEPVDAPVWEDQLLETLLLMEPDAFERLIQRILRESGFSQVEVLGRSGDGGIDGSGILQLGGLLSFRVLFQAKRWQSSVGSSVVRDFRGAMIGRADKGLIVTISSFTPDAKREAVRDGAPAIDLMDGEALVQKLKELSLGVKTKLVEEVTIDRNWFASI